MWVEGRERGEGGETARVGGSEEEREREAGGVRECARAGVYGWGREGCAEGG